MSIKYNMTSIPKIIIKTRLAVPVSQPPLIQIKRIATAILNAAIAVTICNIVFRNLVEVHRLLFYFPITASIAANTFE